MDPLLHPLILYLACGLGGAGVALSLPRPGYSLRAVGGVLAAAGLGLVVLGLSLRAADDSALPSIYFYAFAALGLGAAVRMITHPRPVYSALYFVLTIISTAGLFLLLSAEFMAFALVIIYAGAILITYLFVIMLATQAPTQADESLLVDYDTQAREPWAACLAGFTVLALLTTMLFRGAGGLPPVAEPAGGALAGLPRKVERALERTGSLQEGERVVGVDEAARTVALRRGSQTRTLGPEEWPEGLAVTNVESLGINLLADHPMTLEIAGVLLLMAMLGATVLARKHVELEEDLKARQERRLAGGEGAA